MLVLFAAACSEECTLMAYESTLTLRVTRDDGGVVEAPTGTVTVGDTTVEFDCALTDPAYRCQDADVVIPFLGEGADVEYEVHMPQWVAAGHATPTWSTGEPNGEGCGTQYVGELDVVLLSTP